ncbi:MAG: urease accessory protein UreD [Sinimarinibacterium flocculans]|uniref:urease accessory protein UreD n=1 Tax=Sinimarinibacterium flocculans TaxID=985250 RepID=UPI003C69DDF1
MALVPASLMQALPQAALPLAMRPPWRARLDLAVAASQGRSVLRACRHDGPLRVQKVLYPDGPALAQLILLHPPGGIAGGDELQIDAGIGADAHALLTTPGAGKWYRSNGRVARQSVHLRVSEGATLDWLPQESIVFDGALVEQRLRVDCAPTARCCGWDIAVLGRRARGERFSRGRWSQRIELFREQRLLWAEQAQVDGSDALLDSVVGWNGLHVSGLMWWIGDPIDEALLDAVRALPAAGLHYGVTSPQPGLLLLRALGASAERLRALFTAAWLLLRSPLFGHAALPPRIWST